MLYVFWNVAREGRLHAKRLGNDIYKVYLICGVWTLFLWVLYPIAWALCEGGNVISPDSEAIFYGVLDFLAKPIFSVMLIIGHWKIDPARMGLRIRDVDDDSLHYRSSVDHNKERNEVVGIGIGHNNAPVITHTTGADV